MRGLILKDFYNMLKNIGPTLVTTICVGLLLMVQGNPSLRLNLSRVISAFKAVS